MRLLSRGLLLGVALGCGVALPALAVEKLSQRFSFQGVVTDVPDGAYTVDLEVVGGNSTHSFALPNVQFTNGVFTAMIDGASDAFMNPSLFYTSVGNGDIRVNVTVHLLGGDETFNNIPISSVANAWVANRAVSASMADSAASALALSGVTVQLPALASISDGAILKFNATSKKFVLGVDDNAGSGISQGSGAGQTPALNGSAKWDMSLLDTGVTDGKLLLVGTGDKIPASVIPTSIARVSDVATLTGGTVADTVLSPNIARVSNVATLTSGKIDDSVIPTNIPRMVSGRIVAGDLPTMTATEISDSAINSAKIYDGTIATIDISSAAITGALIADGAVDTADLANGAVTGTKIASDAVTNAKISAGTVNWDKLNISGVTAQGKVLAFSSGSQLQWIPQSPLTTKGDLYVHNGSGPTRLPAVGTDLYVLVTDSASANGVRWMNPDDIGNHGGGQSGGGNYNDMSQMLRIESGSRDANGYNFITSMSNDLTLDATPVPVVVKLADGANPLVGITLSADVTATGLADGIHYVYLDFANAAGASPTLGTSTDVPMYEPSCPTSGVNPGQSCFDFGLKKMREWSGSVWQDKYRIFIGWAVVGAMAVIDKGVYMDSPLNYGGGHGQRLFTTPGTSFMVAPFYSQSMNVEIWGAGGGGTSGGCSGNGGGGGGAGAYSRLLLQNIKGGQVLKMVVGAGGSGGTGGCTVGTSGSATEVYVNGTAVVSAAGGAAGAGGSSGGIGASLPTLGSNTELIMGAAGYDGGMGTTGYMSGPGGAQKFGGNGGASGGSGGAIPGGGGAGNGSSGNGGAGARGQILVSY